MDEELSTTMWNVLERPLFGRRVNWQHVVLFVIIVALLFTRLVDLGNRGYEHDESTHAWESWKVLTGQGYRHDPVYHGPFMYYFTAFTFFLFGTSDATARASMALLSVLLVLLVWPLRRWLGRTGAIFAMLLLTISPTMAFRSRFIWHDAVVMAPTVLMVFCIFEYLSTADGLAEPTRERWLYVLVAALSLTFCGKANAFINGFVLGGFLVLYFIAQVLRGRRPLTRLAVFDLLVLLGTLALPLTAPVVLKALKFNPIDYSAEGLVRIRAVLLVLFLPSAVVGLWWKRRVWLGAAALFYGILLVFHTGFLTNARGVESGLVGSLGYWLSQQQVARGGQPWYYYFFILTVYEFLPVLLTLAATVYYLVRGLSRSRSARQKPAGSPDHASTFVAFLIFWVAVNTVVFTWSGEKMPWQTQHLVLPLCLTGGWLLGQFWDRTSWSDLLKGGLWPALMLLPLGLLALAVLVATTLGRVRPFSGMELDQLRMTLRWFVALAVLIIVFGLLRQFARRLHALDWARIVVVLLVGVLALITVRATWMVCFINQSYVTEFLGFAHGTPDTAMVRDELQRMTERFTGGALRIAYDNESQQPFFWYLRDWPNVSFYTASSGLPTDAHIVLMGTDTESKLRSQVAGKYTRREYRLIWWPDEAVYRNMTPSKLWKDLQDPARRKYWWDILWWRKYPQSPTAWPLVSKFAMYVRKDVPGQIWTAGEGSEGAPIALPVDEYDQKRVQVTAVAQWGSLGSGPGQLSNPKGLDVDGQGHVYVVDTFNHRIQVFDGQGAFVRQWGGQGNGAGQFQEPWGIAVDAEGISYVADTWNHRIEQFDAQGSFLAQWGSFGDTGGALGDPFMLYGPRDVAIAPDGNILVSDTGNKRIVKFTPEGQFVQQWGGLGSLEGQFSEPVGVAVGADGQAYVADTWNQRVQRFGSGMIYAGQWPVVGWESLLPANKPYLAVDSLGNVYVTAPEYHWIARYSPTGQLLSVWGAYGTALAGLNMPSAIALDRDDNLYVVDSGNNRVLKYAAQR